MKTIAAFLLGVLLIGVAHANGYVDFPTGFECQGKEIYGVIRLSCQFTGGE